MVQAFLVQLCIVRYQPFGCRPRFSNQKTEAAVLAVVPFLVLQDQASVDAFLYLSLDLISLLLRSRVWPQTYLVTDELGFQLMVHLEKLVARSWRG